MPNRPTHSVLAAAFLAALAASAARAQAPAAAPAAKVEKSTTAAAVPQEPKTIAEVYNGTGLRDPFVSILGSGGEAAMAESDTVQKPNIHNLQLRGLLAGRSRLAMIEDSSTGARFFLKENGKLYDMKGRAVPGIKGSIKSATSVLLTTPADSDVQWLKLGELK